MFCLHASGGKIPMKVGKSCLVDIPREDNKRNKKNKTQVRREKDKIKWDLDKTGVPETHDQRKITVGNWDM